MDDVPSDSVVEIPEYYSFEQNIGQPYDPYNMWNKRDLPYQIRKRNWNKRLMGRDRMNHLVRFVKRGRGIREQQLEEERYVPEEILQRYVFPKAFPNAKYYLTQ